jgi:amino acid permease
MQVIIVSVRALTIGLFLGGAIYLIINHHGVRKVIPEGKGVFNIENFVEIFSNSVFSLMFHHSLPGIIQNLNVHEAKFVIRNAFIISGSVLMIIPITGVLAFGKDLIGDQLKYYNDDFKEVIPFIYYITSFYVFLNIAAFSVYIIVIRTNILHIINPSINPKKLSRTYKLL